MGLNGMYVYLLRAGWNGMKWIWTHMWVHMWIYVVWIGTLVRGHAVINIDDVLELQYTGIAMYKDDYTSFSPVVLWIRRVRLSDRCTSRCDDLAPW